MPQKIFFSLSLFLTAALFTAIVPVTAYSQSTIACNVSSPSSVDCGEGDIILSVTDDTIYLRPPDEIAINAVTSGTGTITATFTDKGRIISIRPDGSPATGFIATTESGDITATFDGRGSGIFMYPGIDKRATYFNGSGATFTSTSGDINVKLTNSASMFATGKYIIIPDEFPSPSPPRGLNAVTGEDGDINIELKNESSCVFGESGVVAETVSGDINIELSNALIRGIGIGGWALSATSTNGGNITISGDDTGNIASVSRNDSTAVYLDTDGEAKISGVEIWAEGASSKAVHSTGNLTVSDAKIWANHLGGDAVVANTVDVSGGMIWASELFGDAVNAQTVNVSGGMIWTNGETSYAVLAQTVNVSGGMIWTEKTNHFSHPAVNAQTVNVSGGMIWTNGANSFAAPAVNAQTVNMSGGMIWASNGDRSNTVVADTVNMSGGMIWTNGGRAAVALRSEDGQAELKVGGSAIVCGGVLSGTICTASDYGYAVRVNNPTATHGTTITTEGTGNITGRISLSDNSDVFYNNGSFTGHGNTGAGDDTVENKGTFTLTGDFEMGEGDDTFENKDSGMVTYGNHSIIAEIAPTPPTSASSTPSASGDSRFRLSSADPAPEDTTATINFGDGDDHFINNGTIIIQDTGGFNGLEKITFGENSTVMVTADSAEMTTDKPLIELEGEITAEDVKDLNIKLANPEKHSDEFSLFSETALPDSETERQTVLSMISGGLGEGSRAGVDSNGNIFVVLANSVHFNYLRNYDAMIQSAYHSDSAFSEKLRGSCYGGEAETQALSGGCLWADAGSRHTRHDTKVKYGEDAYVFAGGFSIPAGQSAVSIGAGYETSDFNAGTDT
ncbi:MAG: hypothetical protein ACR2NQ_05785, partial [Thermodesulfobacteriota bacterium]